MDFERELARCVSLDALRAIRAMPRERGENLPCRPGTDRALSNGPTPWPQYILIVERDGRLRLLLAEEFALEGYTVMAVSGPVEALAAVAQKLPDLVVLDIQPHDSEGNVLMTHLLTLDSRLPIIVYTGHEQFLDAYRAWGAHACVLKSSDLSELKGVVREALDAAAGAAVPVG